MSDEINIFMDPFLNIYTNPDQTEVAENLTDFYKDIVLKEQQRNTEFLKSLGIIQSKIIKTMEKQPEKPKQSTCSLLDFAELRFNEVKEREKLREKKQSDKEKQTEEELIHITNETIVNQSEKAIVCHSDMLQVEKFPKVDQRICYSQRWVKKKKNHRATMTDLVNPYNEDDRSSQSSGSSSSASQTLSKEETKDKKTHPPHSKCPTISPRNMLRRGKYDINAQTKYSDKPKEKYIKKPEEEDKNQNVANAAANTEDSDSLGLDLEEIIVSSPAEKNKKLKNKLKELENVTLNIAITGMTGAGKSSFVNALRGLPNDDKNAAPTGITETTMKPDMYQHPFMPNVKIWDLPGIGSPKFRAKNYLKDVHFHTYDFFLIVTSERFKKNDIELARAIKKSKKLFYFIRTKIDNDIHAESHKRNFNERILLEKIREDCKVNLLKVGTPKIFLVSSFQLEKYDFQKLINTLEDELPKNKKFPLIQSMPVYSLETLTKKKTLQETYLTECF